MPRSLTYRRAVRLPQQARRLNLAAAGRPPPVGLRDAGMTRRSLVTGTLATAALSALPWPAWPKDAPAPKVAIVGAGLARLSAGWHLRQTGISASLFEASSRVGGRVLTARGAVGDGLITELGGELVNTDHADMLALAKTFGIALFRRPTA
jgi:monoamine oxidase